MYTVQLKSAKRSYTAMTSTQVHK